MTRLPMSSEPSQLTQAEQLAQLKARCSELEDRLDRAGLLNPPEGQGIKGRTVVIIVGLGMAISVIAAIAIFGAAKSSARKREEARKAAKTKPERLDDAHHQMTQGILRCAHDHGGPGQLSVKVRCNLTPKGHVVLLESGVTPRDPDLIRCVRALPASIKVKENPNDNVAESMIVANRGPRAGGALTWDIRANKITGPTPAHPKQ